VLEALGSVQRYASEISGNSIGTSCLWVRDFDAGKIKKQMTYVAEGIENFLILGEVTRDAKIDQFMHQKLFFLENDARILKMLVEKAGSGNAGDLREPIQDYSLRAAMNAVLLEHYLDSAAKNIEQKTLEAAIKGEPHNAAGIHAEAQNAYVEKLQALGRANDYFKTGLIRLSAAGKLPGVPIQPLIIGHRLGEDAELFNIYMTKAMSSQLRAWLAQQQASAFGGK
jgi:hypothetical protein